MRVLFLSTAFLLSLLLLGLAAAGSADSTRRTTQVAVDAVQDSHSSLKSPR